MKLSKKSLGVRVDADTQAVMKSVAASERISINQLVERILVGWVAKRQEGGKASFDWESAIRDLEGLFTDQIERLRAEVVAGEKRLEKSLIALRVMIDASVGVQDPARMDSYRQMVAAMLRQMGVAASNGVTR
jgi:hypothetical protein